MAFAQTFNIGYLKTSADLGEEIFLSVTDNFEYGPGIIRDGVTIPRMRDPHTDSHALGCGPPAAWRDLPETTTNAYVQRAGTWTLFHHLDRFLKIYGEKYHVIGIQSCGDLTMNPWHIALIHKRNRTILCRLVAPARQQREPDEPFAERTYRCLVKWRSQAPPWKHDFIDLQFSEVEDGFHAAIADNDYLDKQYKGRTKRAWLEEAGINLNNIAPQIDFALSGKPIIQKGSEIPLATVIDRFQDVRHIFNLPEVPASGQFGDLPVSKINFGEHELYKYVNTRRAALHSPILVPFRWSGVSVKWGELEEAMRKELFKPDSETPTKRGYYRKYSDHFAEIFFPYNVYPFGVLGGKTDELVGLASGGLSGRIGNTLTGITTIMYDFFGCEDALILDEGFDTFHIVNPAVKTRGRSGFAYDNKRLLDEIAVYALAKFEVDREKCSKELAADREKVPATARPARYYRPGGSDGFTEDMADWHLNAPLIEELKRYCEKVKSQKTYRSIAVEPQRSQIRSVIIFAVPHDRL